MTIRQKIMKLVYPLIMKLGNRKSEDRVVNSGQHAEPPISFYSLKGTLNSKQPFHFSQLKGKKVLLVNVASNCGYTGQYTDLETLYQQHKDKLIVLGFPANDFKDQEPGNDEEIASFCKINFGVTFPLFQKEPVLKPAQQEIYKWLTAPSANGWNQQQPTWNFSKYLVDEHGKLIAFFPASVSPLDKEIISLIRKD